MAGARLVGKVALITGAASGIGRACAFRFAEEGARLALADIDEARLAEVATATGGLALRLDVAEEADWATAMDALLGRFGQLDILVNNAGIALPGPLLKTSLATWRRQHAVNLDGVFLGTRAAIAIMSQRGTAGSIVNVSSIAGLVGLAFSSAYCSSKGAVRLFTKAVALECAEMRWNIRVNSVHPAFIETPMVTGHIETAAEPARLRRNLENRQPLGRLGQPLDVAEAILYLASDEARFVTGAELTVDGGLTAA